LGIGSQRFLNRGRSMPDSMAGVTPDFEHDPKKLQTFSDKMMLRKQIARAG
jgi:hypothetical protein